MYRSYFFEFHSEQKFFDSNQRFWDSIYTVSDRFGPDNYRCITRCGRLIVSKSDILTVLWLYSAFIRTFLTLIWLFNNSVSNWQYVHEDFFKIIFRTYTRLHEKRRSIRSNMAGISISGWVGWRLVRGKWSMRSQF